MLLSEELSSEWIKVEIINKKKDKALMYSFTLIVQNFLVRNIFDLSKFNHEDFIRNAIKFFRLRNLSSRNI